MVEEVVSLKKTDAGNLASNERMMVVGELERELLRKMPASDACSWDRTGMLVGNPMDIVRGVAVALDPTIHAVEETHAQGANVLLTHHPVFIDAPDAFMPQAAMGHAPGAVVRRACELGVSVLSFHTALDVSTAGLDALPVLLRLTPLGVLDSSAWCCQQGVWAYLRLFVSGRAFNAAPPERSLCKRIRHLSSCVGISRQTAFADRYQRRFGRFLCPHVPRPGHLLPYLRRDKVS